MKKPAASGGLSLSRLSDLGSRMGRTQWLWILTASVLLAAALIGMMVIQSPWQDSRRQIGSQLEEEKQRSELLLAIQRKKESLQKAEQDLLLEGGTPALTSEVSRLATESRLAIESVTPQRDFSIPPYTQFQIEIVGAAGQGELLGFLHAIEAHRPLLLLNEMGIGEAPDERSSEIQQLPTAVPEGETAAQRVRMKIGALGRLRKAP